MKILKTNKNGDTIIEVLIALAIVGFILGLSYKLVNRNVQLTRTAQERGEAQKIAEEQIERLKAIAKDPNKQDVFALNPFCINDSLDVVHPGPAPDYPGLAICKKDIYQPKVTHCVTCPDPFMITITWDALGGGKNQVVMYYRLGKYS